MWRTGGVTVSQAAVLGSIAGRAVRHLLSFMRNLASHLFVAVKPATTEELDMLITRNP